ncbi:GNAT family N-acetyltransferase [Enterococcus diestrammenae]|uniref:GNAT family N-acetyltransferase n=1 Tax=Enterococcus diestrammenae TaxID=1155073 RepID=UPI0022DF1489|nr:GNAT family N-acetyltransferase [Enterococcus diestrammenae]
MEIKQTEPAQILACLKEIFASQQLGAIQLVEAATHSISLGAYIAGELVGGIVIKRNYQTAHVSQLAVKSAYQGLGVGKQLLQAGEKQEKERGAKTITLTTRSYQAPAFYQKQGYTCFGQLVDVPMVGVTKYFFVKRFD